MERISMQTYPSLPPITIDAPKPHPLRAVFVTVLTMKLVVCAFLLATVSLAPPVAADTRYMVVAAE
jgi:hypothetical protein